MFAADGRHFWSVQRVVNRPPIFGQRAHVAADKQHVVNHTLGTSASVNAACDAGRGHRRLRNGMALVLSAEAVHRLLPLPDALECAERALASISARAVHNPVRWGMVLPLKDAQGVHVLGHMPAYLPAQVHPSGEATDAWFHPVTQPDGKSGSEGWFASKVVSVFPSNSGTRFSSHQGVVLLFEAEHGSLKCIADAHEVTAIRTAAASAVATRLLSREDAATLAILGSGCQAEMHLKAMLAVRPTLRNVRVWSRTGSSARAFAAKHDGTGGLAVRVAGTVAEALAGADIICTVTSSHSALVHGEDVSPGAHINAVGACFPTQRELATSCIQRARLYVDTRDACLKEPGDIVIPLREGAIAEDHIVGEVGQVLSGDAAGRKSSEDVTVFKSVGAAVEDLCATVRLYEAAQTAMAAGEALPVM